jgi:hypothetical protein
MDNLKQYLQQHKAAMDVDEPAANLWEQIHQPAVPKKTTGIRTITFRLAAAAAILTAMILAGIQLYNPGPEKMIAVQETPAVLPPVQPAPDSVGTATANVVLPAKKDIIPATKKRVSKSKPADERYAMMQSFKENYGQLVKYQLSSIRNTAVYAEDAGYFDDFKIRLKQMDMDEAAIRKIIKQRGISNNLLEQLINVYQQKLDVLKSLQAEMNKINERVKSQPDTTNKYYLNI